MSSEVSTRTDLALTGDSIVARAKHDPLLTRETLASARHFYLGQMDAKDPRVSPLYGDLASLPLVLLHVGEDEILLDDARRYAIYWRSLVRQPSCTSGRAWCTSCPPTLPSCMPRARRSTSPTTS